MPKDLQEIELTSLLPKKARALLQRSGLDFVEREGLDSIRDLVLEVFMGRNFRNSTELLTRDRISTLNLGLLHFYIEGIETWPNFIDRLPHVAAENIKRGGMSKGETWLNNWILGLTGKGFQNILRDDPEAAEEYAHTYSRITEEAAEERIEDRAKLADEMGLSDEDLGDLDWNALSYLLNTVGSATLTIRGSDKSTFGKILEKPILGSLFHVLGFEYIEEGKAEDQEGVYWLNSSERRESDATLIFEKGKAFRFDIGFIGRGNPEIILDKVTRYRNHMELGNEEYFLRTVVLADRLGDASDVKSLAEEANGYVITMETPLWPRELANHLENLYGFDNEIVGANDDEAEELIKDRLSDAPLRKYLQIARGEEDDDAPDVEVEESTESKDVQEDLFDN